MKRTGLVLLLFALIPSCGNDGGNKPQDATIDSDLLPPADARVDAQPAPPTITITGQAVTRNAQGAQPVANATIAGYRSSDDSTAIATTTTNAQGAFTLTIQTGGVALDGYLKATAAPPLLDCYLYPSAPIAADITAPINMVSESTVTLLFALAEVTKEAGKGMIAIQVVDGQSTTATPIAGASVSSVPASGAYRYNNPATGLPGNATITSTHTDGIAYMLNVRSDASVVVSAAKPGTTFKSHGLKARPDVLTTTLITP